MDTLHIFACYYCSHNCTKSKIRFIVFVVFVSKIQRVIGVVIWVESNTLKVSRWDHSTLLSVLFNEAPQSIQRHAKICVCQYKLDMDGTISG